MAKKNKEEQFFLRMKALLGETGARELIEALKPLAAKSVRYNRLHLERGDLENVGLKPVPWCEFGRYWPDGTQPSRTIDYAAGNYYIQESSAMLPVAVAERVMDFKGKVVLDMTAAPGGKTTQAAEIIGDGYLVANEVVRKRCDALIWNVIRHRLNNVVVTSFTNDELVGAFTGFFDIVMVDAPCSGEGLFQKRKNTLSSWSERNVKFCAKRQYSILDDAAVMVKPGGYIVYSTCTFSQEENEEQVEYLLEKDFQPVELPGDVPVSGAISENPDVLKCSRRVFPHKEGGAGSFVAVLKKDENIAPTGHRTIRWKHEPPKTNITLPGYLKEPSGLAGHFYESNGVVSYFSHDRIPGILRERSLQLGAPVLDKRKDNAVLFGSTQIPAGSAIIEISETGALNYCKGGELQVENVDGFYFVSYKGKVLGPVKVTDGRATNRLPMPLRHR